jgi:hypothetical protein
VKPAERSAEEEFSMDETKRPKSSLGKLTWEEKHPATYISYPTRTADRLREQVLGKEAQCGKSRSVLKRSHSDKSVE